MQTVVRSNLNELFQKRGLLLIWLKYRIEERYSQTVLGILWIILLPLSTSAVLAFAFTEILGTQSLIGEIAWINFLLAGIAIFAIFRDSVLKSKGIVVGSASLIGRIYFPREILILLVLGETIIDFFFVLIALVLINASQGIYPSWHYIFLPLPIGTLLLLSAGISFLVAWKSIVIQDLQQLLTVLMQLLFYLVVPYSPERVTNYTKFIDAIPLTPIIAEFRAIVLFNTTPNILNLAYPFVVSIVVLYIGYANFKANEDRFLDFL